MTSGPWVNALGLALLHSIWIGAVIAGWTALSLRVLHHAGPIVRYRLALGALFTLAMVPAVLLAGGQAGSPWMGWVAGAWAAGALAALVRLGSSARLVRRLLQSATPVDAAWHAQLDRCASQLGLAMPVALGESPMIDVPCSIGSRRPAILVPNGLLRRITPEVFRALAAHELAHVARRDYAWNLAQVMAEALLFYHPAAAWLGRAARTERELCCDALAASLCEPVQLARALAVAEKARQVASARTKAAASGSLLARVRDLVGQQDRPARSTPRWLAPAALSTSGAALALVLVWAVPIISAPSSSSSIAYSAAIGLGLMVGLRHAFEPDHLMAIATMVSRERTAQSAMWLGATWGIGHTGSLLVLSTLLALARQAMPDWIGTTFEVAVAIMITAMGIRALRDAWRFGSQGPARLHAHGSTEHTHGTSEPHIHIGRWPLAKRPLSVGLLHGLAGSGALTALAGATMPTLPAQITFILVFGLGSTAAMTAVTALAGWPLARFVRTGPAAAALSAATGVAAIAFGVLWGVPLLNALLRG